ncbi:MAG: TIM44-like domain-containing protein [Candidatus Kinetoplastibacterium crithidii]|nr:TIM44-like domain-containing protein [Candidatus Kinetoplastibacterium crithidii]
MFVIIISVSILAISFNADARRIGNGGSYGKQFSNISKIRNNNNYYSNKSNNHNKSSINKEVRNKKDRSILGAVLSSLWLAAIFSFFGMNSLFLNVFTNLFIWLLVVGIAIYVIRKHFLSKFSVDQVVENNNFVVSRYRYPYEKINNKDISEAKVISDDFYDMPDSDIEFNKDSFLNDAKRIFIYIQEIWNKRDQDNLKEYLTEELLLELQNQFDAQLNFSSKVLELDAEFLSMNKLDDCYLTSICFHGFMEYSNDEKPLYFEEIWNFQKYDGTGWLLSGIQQKNT